VDVGLTGWSARLNNTPSTVNPNSTLSLSRLSRLNQGQQNPKKIRKLLHSQQS
jgi:hypothetical protein